MEIATNAVRAVALEVLQAGRVHPYILVLAAALAGEMHAETGLDDVAKVVRDVGQNHAEALRAVELQVAGNA